MQRQRSPLDALREAMRSPHGWVTTTYFAEGFPYSIVHSLSEAIFVARGYWTPVQSSSS